MCLDIPDAQSGQPMKRKTLRVHLPTDPLNFLFGRSADRKQKPLSKMDLLHSLSSTLHSSASANLCRLRRSRPSLQLRVAAAKKDLNSPVQPVCTMRKCAARGSRKDPEIIDWQKFPPSVLSGEKFGRSKIVGQFRFARTRHQ